MRKKPNLAPRLEKCADLLVTAPESLRGRWLNEFRYNELHIELGCGKGLFTAETAKSDPGAFIAALEKSADAMVIALERAKSEGLHNTRFINAFADNLTDYFAPGEAARIYINFCDPWPSNRHVKRRLTSSGFLSLYKNVLRPGGEVHFKTDCLSLFEFSLREFELAGFEVSEIVRDLHKNGPAGVMTDYELRFCAQGLPIYKARFVNFNR
jgi:tRNA (guanine-N7-)-methyltransferase